MWFLFLLHEPRLCTKEWLHVLQAEDLPHASWRGIPLHRHGERRLQGLPDPSSPVSVVRNIRRPCMHSYECASAVWVNVDMFTCACVCMCLFVCLFVLFLHVCVLSLKLRFYSNYALLTQHTHSHTHTTHTHTIHMNRIHCTCIHIHVHIHV